jgi:hypothetical protein
MHELLLTTWLCLPIAPLNPTEQDTLTDLTFHLTAGLANSNGIVSVGPNASAKFEMMVIHPWVIRVGVDYRYATFNSQLYPKGDLNMFGVSSDVLYYRGTNHLTGYLGFGVSYAANKFSANQGTRDSLRRHAGITDIAMQPQWGYRFTMGLRVNRKMSIEISVTDIRPRFKYRRQYSASSSSHFSETTNTGSFQVAVGRVWEIISRRHTRGSP